MNKPQRLLLWIGIAALLGMTIYPPHTHYYDWLWEGGAIDLSKVLLQWIATAAVFGILIYGLRPAGVQAIVKRKKTCIFLAILAVSGVGIALIPHQAWQEVYWWWHKFPSEQVKLVSAEAIPFPGLVDLGPAPASHPAFTNLPKGAVLDPPPPPGFDEVLPPPVGLPPLPKGAIAIDYDPFAPLHLLVKNASQKGIHALSIRIQYPKRASWTKDFLYCPVAAGGEYELTLSEEHYEPGVRVEVLKAWEP